MNDFPFLCVAADSDSESRTSKVFCLVSDGCVFIVVSRLSVGCLANVACFVMASEFFDTEALL